MGNIFILANIIVIIYNAQHISDKEYALFIVKVHGRIVGIKRMQTVFSVLLDVGLIAYNKGATDYLDLAEYFNMDDSTFKRVIDDPKKYRNEDFLTLICLFFKLPDWLSRLVF